MLLELYWYYLTHSWEDKGVHAFPKGICSKVYIIAELEFELAFYNSVVHRFNHYTTVWFGFFVLWHINLSRLFNAKSILQEEQ